MCRNIKTPFNFEPPAAEVAKTSEKLLRSLVTSAAPRNREVEAARAHARAVRRFGS